MDRQVLVSLLKPLVLLDEVQVIPPDHNGSLHLHLENNSCQDSTSDGNVTSERAFFVNVGSFNCLSRNSTINIYLSRFSTLCESTSNVNQVTTIGPIHLLEDPNKIPQCNIRPVE